MFVTGLTVVIHAWQMLANKFLTYPVPHYCKRPGKKNKKLPFFIKKWEIAVRVLFFFQNN